MSLEENKALVLRLFDEGLHGPLMSEIYSPDYMLHSAGRCYDREGSIEVMSSLYSSIPDLTFTCDDVMAIDDKVIVRLIGCGTHLGENFGAPTCNQVTFPLIHIARIENGKIVEAWEEYDMFSLMQQFGIISEDF